MRRKAACYGIYTLVFLALAWCVFSVFPENGRNFVWDRDGLYQTYTAMVYISEYWKEWLHNLWTNHELLLPMMDYRIGLGSDVMTTLNHYGFGDPLLLLSVFVKREHMEGCYAFLAMLRYYLAGAAFLAYCFYGKRREFPSLIGAVVYAFCGYALYAGVRHPYFLNSMWYFPLMLIGVEQIFQRKKGIVLTLVTALAACSNFYFLYLLTMLTFLYAMVRFASAGRERSRRSFFYILGRGCGCYFLGLGLGALFLLPNMLAFLGNARGGIKETGVSSLLFYGGEFYRQVLAGTILPEFSADYWTVLSMAPMAFLGCVLVLAAGERRHLCSRILFLLLTLVLLIPAGGYVLNGFSYVSNRWIYGYAWILAYMMVQGLEILPFVRLKHVLLTGWILPAAGAAAWLGGGFSDGLAGRALWLAALNYLLLILFVIFNHVWKGEKIWRRAGLSWTYGGILALSAAVICVHGEALYAPEHGDYVSQFHPKGQNLEILSQCAEASAPKPSEDQFFRTDGGSINVVNNSMVLDFYGTGGFFSIVSEDIFQYMKAMEVDDIKFPNWYYGFGGRTALNTLASVKYYGNNAGTELAVPYGYEAAGGDVYENTRALPVAYTYDQVLDGTEFAALSPVKKQEAMMQAVVLDGTEQAGATADGVKHAAAQALQYDADELSWTVSSIENMQWNQETGALIIGSGGGDLWLEFQGEADSETYLRFVGYDINDSGYELLTVNVECGDAYWKKFYEASTKSVWYGDLHNFIVNLGWRQEARNQVHINFPFEGEFRLEDLQLFSVPMEPYDRFMAQRGEKVLQNLAVRGNQVSGTISLDQPEMLFFSIPYSKGWKAAVDGASVDIYKANLMFMAVPLEAGEHLVELTYQTPGLMTGTLVSVGSAGVFLAVILQKKRRNHRRKGRSRRKKIMGSVPPYGKINE